MMTTVTVHAHCSSEKEVKVVVKEGRKTVDKFTLQDGQARDCSAYDDRVITVKEVVKEQ